MRDVLILRAPGLGDFLTGIPSYRGVHRYFAGHRIVLATAPEHTELARLTGVVDEVLAARGLDELCWDRPPPDVVVNLHGKGPRSHQLLLDLSPRRRIGFRSPGWSGPDWRPDDHEVDRWCRLLHSAGIAADPTHLRLPAPPSPSAAPGAVVIHPGAGYASRRWPPDRYAEVARRLAATGRSVVVTGSGDERPLAEHVARQAGLPGSSVLAGELDLVGFAAVVAAARLVICGDTGPGHLATAYATPSVLLFGPVSPRLAGPPASQRHRVIWHGPHRGDRAGARPDPALLAVTPGEVLAAARTLLRTPAAAAGASTPARGLPR